MTQAFNLSQLANKVNTSGQLDATTGLSGATPIANGGTNNGSLAVTAGGVLYTDGTKIVNVGAGTTGQALLSQGASPPIWGTAGAVGTLIGYNVYTTPGTATYSKGTNNPTFVIVQVVGGGGAGGSKGSSNATVYGGSGGSGGFSQRKILASSLGASETVTVGAGGNAGYSSGNAGGTSSFGSWCSATGGGGGVSDSAGGNGGTSGAGASGDINAQGQAGISTSLAYANAGGNSFYSGGGRGGNLFGNGNGLAGTLGSGGGGAGGNSSSNVAGAFGGAGGAGIVVVWEYK